MVAPGRINVIGEHVDYAGGLCLPAAVDRHLAVAVAPADGVEVASEGRQPVTIEPSAIAARGDWADLALGVVRGLGQGGMRVAIASDIPAGAGLSSSAALASALAVAGRRLEGATTDGFEIAKLCQRVENDFLGVPSGLMDQVACLFGRRDNALLFDPEEEWVEAVALPAGLTWLVCESGVERDLRDSAYGERPREAEAALDLARARRPDLDRLSDLDAAEVEELGLPTPLDRRARHIAGEVKRVRLAVACIEAGNGEALGQLLVTSHRSLARDCEVSTPELDDLVEVALAAGCLGARMMGGGFGGSVLALVAEDSADAAAKRIGRRYRPPDGGKPSIHRVRAVDGILHSF